jgi:glutathione reductase (NADPH)
MARFDFDLFTLGAGSGGVAGSRRAGSYGAKVAVCEDSRVGGTCVMRGCVPKKLLVYGAGFALQFQDSRGFGWSPGEPAFAWPALIAAKDRELDRLEGVYDRMLAGAGVTMIRGAGRLRDRHTVEIEGEAYTAEHILIAVGGWPVLPEIPGVEHAITSNEALELPFLPKRIVIVGGGYIAVEFAGIFNALGARVTEVIRAANILRGFDEDVRVCLAAEMARLGIVIRADTRVVSVERSGAEFAVLLSDETTLRADAVMFATGRRPNTAGLGLAEAGVELDEAGAVVVDEFSRTRVENISAIGDCTNRVNLTPVALAEGMAFARTVFGGTPTPMAYDGIPSAVFSNPPVGTVGLTEEQARRRGPIDIYVSRFKPMKHTLSGRDERTMMKLVVDRQSDRVLGCHMVGADAPEITQGLAIALQCGATKAQFDRTIGIHPSAAEEFVTMREKAPEPEAVAAAN